MKASKSTHQVQFQQPMQQ